MPPITSRKIIVDKQQLAHVAIFHPKNLSFDHLWYILRTEHSNTDHNLLFANSDWCRGVEVVRTRLYSMKPRFKSDIAASSLNLNPQIRKFKTHTEELHTIFSPTLRIEDVIGVYLVVTCHASCVFVRKD